MYKWNVDEVVLQKFTEFDSGSDYHSREYTLLNTAVSRDYYSSHTWTYLSKYYISIFV